MREQVRENVREQVREQVREREGRSESSAVIPMFNWKKEALEETISKGSERQSKRQKMTRLTRK